MTFNRANQPAARRKVMSSLRVIAATGLMFLAALHSSADTLRITTWDMGGGAWADALSQPGQLSQSQNITLQSLRGSTPDVILLQNAPDWQGCQRIASLLKPGEYQVISCSAFRDDSNHVSQNGQAAILARQHPFISWTEEWFPGQTPSSGFAFAAFRRGDRRIGVFSMETGAASLSGATAMRLQERKLLQSIQSLDNWGSNQLQEIILCGTLTTLGRDPQKDDSDFAASIRASGFQSKLDWMPDFAAGEKRSIQFVFSRGVSVMANLAFAPVPGDQCKPLTCDFVLPPETSPVTPGVLPLEIAATNPGAKISISKSARAGESVTAVNTLQRLPVLAGAAVLTLIVSLLVISVRIRQARERAIREKSVAISQSGAMSAGGLVLTERERSGVVAGLSLWLRQRFVQKLLSERAQLAQSQNQAALAVMKLDERLSEVEKQVRRREKEYEDRIGELNRELAVAQEENRELIRSKIEVLKLEMAKSSSSAPFNPPGQRN